MRARFWGASFRSFLVGFGGGQELGKGFADFVAGFEEIRIFIFGEFRCLAEVVLPEFFPVNFRTELE